MDPRPSVGILTCMALILFASITMFFLVARQWTGDRHWVALKEYAQEAGLFLSRYQHAVLPPILMRAAQTPRALISLICKDTSIVQIETRGVENRDQSEPSLKWNVLVRPIDSLWPATALHPTASPRSLVDLFSLSSFLSLSTSERFVVFGSESRAAARLSKSIARGLLPKDIGLVLIEHFMILDFSMRPFDPIEFQRVLALADQLQQHVSSAA